MEVIGWLMADRRDIRRALRENPVIARPVARMDVKDKPVTLRAKDLSFIFVVEDDGREISRLEILSGTDAEAHSDTQWVVGGDKAALLRMNADLALVYLPPRSSKNPLGNSMESWHLDLF
jgi:hypothetical protein